MAVPTFQKKQARLAAALVATLLAATLLPLSLVSADHPDGNGYIVVFTPQDGDVRDGGLFMNAELGYYHFDVEVFDANGDAFPLTQYGFVVYSLEGNGSCTGSSNPQCLYVTGGQFAEATNTFTVSVPSAAIAFQGEFPSNGVGVYLVLHRDADGNTLLNTETGTLPTGHYSALTEGLFSQSSFAEADQADGHGTPIFVADFEVDGVIEAGNPLINPGFEATVPNGQGDGYRFPGAEYGFSSAIPPWVLFRADPTDGNSEPASAHFLATHGGAGGSYASIHYDIADNGQNLIYGQFISPPVGGLGAWVAGEGLTLSFDASANGNFGWVAGATVHYMDENGVEQWLYRASSTGVPGSYDWQATTYDFSAIPAGSQLVAVFFTFDQNLPDYAILKLDNVKLNNAVLVANPPSVSMDNDLNDGFSGFILPQGGVLTPSMVLRMEQLQLNGMAAYVFEVSAEDYTAGGADSVDLHDGLHFQFDILNEQALTQGIQSSIFTTSTKMRFLDDEGNLSERALVVVPGDAVTGRVVPWMYKDIAVGDTYENTFGSHSEPVSGYHSVVRNQMMGLSLADHFDYAFTPIILEATVGGSLLGETVVTVECPDAIPGLPCVSDPTPDLVVNFSTTSRVLEDVTVELYAMGDPSLVLGTAVMTAPEGTATFHLDQAQMDALYDLEDLRVMARTTGGLFTSAATSADYLRLDNSMPIANFVITPAEGLTSLTTITVADDSVDVDGSIEKRSWLVSFVSDSTDDMDDISGWTLARPNNEDTGENQLGFTFSVPDDGDFELKLIVEDNDGAYTETTQQFSVANVAPTASIETVEFAGPNQAVTMTGTADDADGSVLLDETVWSIEPAPLSLVAGPFGETAEAIFAVGGEYTISLSVVDDDLETTTVTRLLVIDDVGAETTVSIEEVPATGWFTEAVDVTITRSDDFSGVAFTRSTVNGALAQSRTGESDYVRTISQDGEYVFAAESTDRAGNTGPAATVSFGIDTQAPTVALAESEFLPLLPWHVHNRGETVTLVALATDVTSQVAKVEFFRDGRLLGTDTDGADGWSFDWDTSLDTGVWDVFAIAYDNAGHSTTSSAHRYIIHDI